MKFPKMTKRNSEHIAGCKNYIQSNVLISHKPQIHQTLQNHHHYHGLHLPASDSGEVKNKNNVLININN